MSPEASMHALGHKSSSACYAAIRNGTNGCIKLIDIHGSYPPDSK